MNHFLHTLFAILIPHRGVQSYEQEHSTFQSETECDSIVYLAIKNDKIPLFCVWHVLSNWSAYINFPFSSGSKQGIHSKPASMNNSFLIQVFFTFVLFGFSIIHRLYCCKNARAMISKTIYHILNVQFFKNYIKITSCFCCYEQVLKINNMTAYRMQFE